MLDNVVSKQHIDRRAGITLSSISASLRCMRETRNDAQN
jgi:hypothetical protein